MTSPMLTVVVLAVLWLIVVVPMIVRRKDERAGERSVARFGSAMRALASRRSASLAPKIETPEIDPRPAEPAVSAVPIRGPVTRRPVPGSKESLMYPPDRNELSDARRQMLKRRRRSLTTLFTLSGLLLGGGLVTTSIYVWALAGLAVASLSGYLLFLRSQARRDRQRREMRVRRAATRSSADYDATAQSARSARQPESAVRIDEDDVDLDHLDTVDLTGLYSEVEFDDVPIRRAG